MPKKEKVELPEEDIRDLRERIKETLEVHTAMLIQISDELRTLPAKEVRLQIKAKREKNYRRALAAAQRGTVSAINGFSPRVRGRSSSA